MSSTTASNQAQIITNIAFGIAATGISIITVWQGHRVWKLWHAYHCHIKVSTDLELGQHCSPPTPKPRQLLDAGSSAGQSIYEDPDLDLSGDENTAPGLAEGIEYLNGSVSPLDLAVDVKTLHSVQADKTPLLPARRYTAVSCFDFGLNLPSERVILQRSKSLGIAHTVAHSIDSRESRSAVPPRGAIRTHTAFS